MVVYHEAPSTHQMSSAGATAADSPGRTSGFRHAGFDSRRGGEHPRVRVLREGGFIDENKGILFITRTVSLFRLQVREHLFFFRHP